MVEKHSSSRPPDEKRIMTIQGPFLGGSIATSTVQQLGVVLATNTTISSLKIPAPKHFSRSILLAEGVELPTYKEYNLPYFVSHLSHSHRASARGGEEIRYDRSSVWSRR